MTRLIILLAFASLACMTATVPSSDGRLGGKVSTEAAVTDTPKVTFGEAESLFIVTVDSLQIRPCPYKDDETCPPYQYGFVAGDVVMGACYVFGNETWLGFDHNSDGYPTKFAAVIFNGQTFMEGQCR